jgi:hypothetical protein
VVRRFKRLATLAAGLHTAWQADLADLQRLKRWNRGYGYLLVCIDTLSRQIFAEPVKTKHSGDMIKAWERVFTRCGYIPWRILSDAGREFTGSAVHQFFKAKNVEQHCMKTSPLWHAGMAERANRSIKERLYRYFTHRGTKCWLDAIQRIVNGLNATPNSSIFGLRPKDVTFANAERLRRRLARKAEEERWRVVKEPRFRVGDEVRVEKRRHVFRKGYLPTFSDEVFQVKRVRERPAPVTYKLADSNGLQLDGWFYAQELCLVMETERGAAAAAGAKDPIYEIDHVVRRRVKMGREECLVKWKGYSEEHNSWILATSII